MRTFALVASSVAIVAIANAADPTLPPPPPACTADQIKSITAGVTANLEKISAATKGLTGFGANQGKAVDTACGGGPSQMPTTCSAECKTAFLAAKEAIAGFKKSLVDSGVVACTCSAEQSLANPGACPMAASMGMFSLMEMGMAPMDKLCGTGASGRVELTVLSVAMVLIASAFTMF